MLHHQWTRQGPPFSQHPTNSDRIEDINEVPNSKPPSWTTVWAKESVLPGHVGLQSKWAEDARWPRFPSDMKGKYKVECVNRSQGQKTGHGGLGRVRDKPGWLLVEQPGLGRAWMRVAWAGHRIPPITLWVYDTQMHFTRRMQTLLEGQVWVWLSFAHWKRQRQKKCKTHREHMMSQRPWSLLEFGIQWSRF